MTRRNPKFTRIYANGYDISGEASNIGTVGYTQDAPMVAAYSDDVLNSVLGQSQIQCGPINAFLSPSVSIGIHELFNGGMDVINVLIAFGSLAVPAVGDPVFAWTMRQGGYTADGAEGVVGVNIPFPNADYSTVKGYHSPFGLLVHAKGAETAANTAEATIDNTASSAKGGIFAYQLFSSNGTVTLKLQEADTNLNANFADLTGATSGIIDASVTPASGMVALSTTATVKRYIRWQLAFGTATTATFALAFIRGT